MDEDMSCWWPTNRLRWRAVPGSAMVLEQMWESLLYGSETVWRKIPVVQESTLQKMQIASGDDPLGR